MLKGNLLYVLYAAIAGAVGIGGFYVVPKLVNGPEPERPAIVESQPTDSSETARPVEEEPEAAQEVAKVDSDAVAPEAVEKPIVPGFDIVRVEPDGSMLIAGFGSTNSKMDVVNGEAVIASTDVGQTGDFVAVLDEPLPPGDYVLRLRNILGDGTTVLSADAATISVPEDPDGQLLAMVGKPGEASRILTQPAAEAVEPEPKEIAELASDADGKAEQTEIDVKTPELPAGALEITGNAPAVETPAAPVSDAEQTAESEKVDAVEPKADAEPAPEAAETEDTEPAVEVAKTEATEPAVETAKIEEAQPAAEAAKEEEAEVAAEATKEVEIEPATDTEAETEVATVDPEVEQTEETPVKPAIVPVIRVDAVEIEGDKIFVAGAASPGFSVRVLADDTEIGTAIASDDGRFIVESSHQLAVGEHKIAAELLSPEANEIVLRAVVPFVRPEGERMAAVAASEPEPPVESAAEAETEVPASEATTPIAEDAPTSTEVAPAKTEDVPASTEVAPASTEVAENEAKTVSQAALEPAAGSVIIRRGDTLWQISRRTYGQGVRYTTIYLANRQQIVDPDRISPGQIFQVPDTPESIPEAERLHNELLSGQKPGAN